MTIGAAIDNLMFNYGSMAELDRESLKQLIRSGQEQGFTVRQCYNGIRLCLGLEYQQQEVFSTREAAEMLEISEGELLNEMLELGVKPKKQKGKVFFFPEGI
jgi:hypothetical protein